MAGSWLDSGTMAWHDAAAIMQAGSARPWLPLTVAGTRVVIAHVDGAWFGFEDRCAHAGCAFSEDGELAGGDVICNCHGSEYDVSTGAVRRGPAERPIRTFPVRIVGDRLEIDV